ncbi:CAP domain-containing protein [Candidatus Gracilibacteria bacterium]|nr:CAP domain-containing protein [Candidatus Gracilibacteria bacterium]
MRKSIIFIGIVTLLSFFYPQIHSQSHTEQQIITKITQKLTDQIQKNPKLKTKLLNKLSFVEQKIGKNHPKYSLIVSLRNNISEFPHLKKDIPEPNYRSYFIDGETLKQNWLKYYNDYRSENGITELKRDSRLENTAREWANISLERGNISHERNIGDGWYNYPIIEQWFQDRGVKCRVSGRTTSVENTGYHAYYCPDRQDCTKQASKALKDIFDAYVAEKGLSYPANAHYKTTVSPYLNYMGLGISFYDEGNGWIQIYTVAHFCTEFQ